MINYYKKYKKYKNKYLLLVGGSQQIPIDNEASMSSPPETEPSVLLDFDSIIVDWGVEVQK
jgi:hypothetical protein